MTDGRANVALDGAADPPRASDEAYRVAGEVCSLEIPTLFLDTAPRPRARARALAERMGAHYLPLPYLDAGGISREVGALRPR